MAKPAFKFKKLWFDDRKVVAMTTRKERRALNRFGGTVRKHAQYSMKTRKEVSKPGNPPHAHGRKLLKRLLFYSFVPSTRSVVVGPVRLKETADFHVPKTLEKGGRGKLVSDSGAVVAAQYRARPYMEKAAAPYYGKIAKWYADA